VGQIDAAAQRRIMGRFATGVTIVTTGGTQGRWGMTANALTSLSLDPPLILFAIEMRNEMRRRIQQHRCFAVNVLADSQLELSNRFARPGPKDFDGIELHLGTTGAPLLAHAIAYVECELHQVYPGGDHEIVVGKIVAGADSEGEPLLFYGGGYHDLGGPAKQ
jgi:flavin reductase (DIM6/NTAB) family NADH-FMN oxidoreductase RutF